ncbi:CapA family protein [Carboxylicivirga taeanensis]|uniref:CapA family protein n=1 Tax=Carboxylicivirga taeanensis TaxID=1416875 RepID=UPI003F6DCDA1
MRKSILLLITAFGIFSSAFSQSANSGLSFVGVGDMMFGTHFPTVQYLPPNNNPWPLVREVAPVFAGADVVFGNLEGAFLDEGKVFKSCRDTTKCYAFKTPTSYAPVLKKAGFDFVSIANNHIRDFGPPGLISTRRLLDSLDIAFAGLVDKPSVIKEIDGQLVGLCAFAPNTGTAKIGDIEGAVKIVKELDATCDYVIVSFHGGAEGRDHMHVTRETEMFYGENRGNVYAFAHAVIDAGADVVFGHGPHVPRSIEIYKNRFIAYSLGNFCTYSRFNLSGPNRLAPVVQVWTNRDGAFVRGKIHAFHQIKGKGTLRDHGNAVVYKMRDLTRMDFPELNHRLVIDDDGDFYMPFEEAMRSRGLSIPGYDIKVPEQLPFPVSGNK